MLFRKWSGSATILDCHPDGWITHLIEKNTGLLPPTERRGVLHACFRNIIVSFKVYYNNVTCVGLYWENKASMVTKKLWLCQDTVVLGQVTSPCLFLIVRGRQSLSHDAAVSLCSYASRLAPPMSDTQCLLWRTRVGDRGVKSQVLILCP